MTAQEIDLNTKLEEILKAQKELANEYQIAQTSRRAATRKLEEAVLAIAEVNKIILNVKTKQNKIKKAIKRIKIKMVKKNNKNEPSPIKAVESDNWEDYKVGEEVEVDRWNEYHGQWWERGIITCIIECRYDVRFSDGTGLMGLNFTQIREPKKW